MRLGHRVAGEQLALQQGSQVSLLLVLRAVVRDDLGVAGVGRLAAEDDRCPLGPAENLVEQRELELSVTLAAQVGPEMGGPQPLLADLFLQRVNRFAAHAVQRHELLMRERKIERLDLLADELIGPIEHLLVLRVGFEIPHAASLPIRVGCIRGRVCRCRR